MLARGALGLRRHITAWLLPLVRYPSFKWFARGPGAAADAPLASDATAEAIAGFVLGALGLPAPAGPRAPGAVRRPRGRALALSERTFDAVAFDPERHVLVAFVAPWCAHSKALLPAFDEAARAFAGEPRVTLATVDATSHRPLAQRSVSAPPPPPPPPPRDMDPSARVRRAARTAPAASMSRASRRSSTSQPRTCPAAR